MARRRTRRGGARPPGGEPPPTLYRGDLHFKVYKADGTIKEIGVPSYTPEQDESGHEYIPPNPDDMRDPVWESILEWGDIMEGIYNGGYIIGPTTIYADSITGSPVVDVYSESENPSLPPDVEVVYTNDSDIDETLTVRFDRWEQTGIAPGDEADEAIEFSNEHFGPRPQPPAPANWPVGAGAGPAPSGGRRQTRRRRQRGGAGVMGDLSFDVYADDVLQSEVELPITIASVFGDVFLGYERPILNHIAQYGYKVGEQTEIAENQLNRVIRVEKAEGAGMPPNLELAGDAVVVLRIVFTQFESDQQPVDEEAPPAPAGPIGAGAGPPVLLPQGRRARERAAQREPVGEPAEVAVERQEPAGDPIPQPGGRRKRKTYRRGKKHNTRKNKRAT
jgi:hypothetical protein